MYRTPTTISLALSMILTVAAQGSSQSPTVIDNPAPNYTTPAFRISAQPVIKLGGLNNDARYEFAAIWATDITTTGKLVVLPGRGQEVRVFDMRGQHLRTLGRRGQGPGEFTQAVQALALGGDTIAVYDNLPQKVTLFDAGTGAVLRTIPDAPNALCCFPDASFLVSLRTNRPDVNTTASAPEKITWSLASGPEGKTRKDSILTTRGNDPEIRLGRFEIVSNSGGRAWTLPAALPPFARTAATILAGNTVVHAVSDKFELRVHSPAGVLLRTVRAAAPTLTPTRADIDAGRKAWMNGADTPEKVKAYEEHFNELKLYTTLPFFGRVLGDSDGSIWVQNYMRPGTTLQVWARFDPQGRLAGTLRTPDKMLVRKFTRGYVTLVPEEQADGVATLLVHRIEPVPR